MRPCLALALFSLTACSGGGDPDDTGTVDPGDCTEVVRVGGLITGDRLLREGGCYVVEQDILVTGNMGEVIPGDPDHPDFRLESFAGEQGILQIALIASFFNYVNRVADGIGVGR